MPKKTSLPKSIKIPKASKSAKEKPKETKISLDGLLEARDYSIVHPEEMKIGYFRAQRETFDAIGRFFNVDELDTLYGFKCVVDPLVNRGMVEIRDLKGKFIDSKKVF